MAKKSNRLQLQEFLKSATTRLTLSYLAIIMLMSIGFSVVFYNVSARELGRRGPIPGLDDHGLHVEATTGSTGSDDSSHGGSGSDTSSLTRDQVRAYLDTRAKEGREALLGRLIGINLVALGLGTLLSYYLARRTLQPIEENMEAQAQFVSDASHELRTPLTAMQTMNEVALRRPKITEADSRDLIGKNLDEVIKLRALTDGLLKLARQDGTALPLSTLSLQDITAEALNRVVDLAQSKKISVDDKVGAIRVSADTASLIQALVILLDNAIKYSPAGTTIHLTSSTRGKFATLSVRDEGTGIRPYDLRKIFDRFYRADQSRSSTIIEGHGIGLSLAKKIMEQHGGDVTAQSTVGKGSTFTMRVPLA